MLAMSSFSSGEIILLWSVLGVAVLGLLYAGFLMGSVLREDRGTAKMIQVSDAIKEGSNAYLAKQLKTISFLIETIERLKIA